MGRYLIRRLLLALPVIFGVMTLVFLLMHLIPGDPVQIMLGESAKQADLEQLRHQLHLDRPLLDQYRLFLSDAIRGDLGESFHLRRPVVAAILERAPATIELAVAAMLFACGLALPLGLLSAARPRSGWDLAALTTALLGVSMPSFWLGPLLVLLFALTLDWLPVSGRDSFSSVILPAVTLGSGMAAILMRMTRSSLLEVMRQDYVAVARAKGLPAWRVWLRYGLRTALLPLLTLLGLQIGALLAGAVITETIFAWPGLGRLTVQAILSRDYPLVQGCVLAVALGYVAVNLATDLLYAVADPRIRYGRQER
ncbi:MAG: ABC transporter permease [Nitrospirae bacterium]|nr:ABC transporter permease [Nitrospirota bacterium]